MQLPLLETDRQVEREREEYCIQREKEKSLFTTNAIKLMLMNFDSDCELTGQVSGSGRVKGYKTHEVVNLYTALIHEAKQKDF